MHAGEVPGEVVLSGECLHSWLAGDALVGSKFADLLWLNADIRPVEVPISGDILIQLVVHLSAHSFDHVVASGVRAQYQLLVRLLLGSRFRGRRLSLIVLVFRLHLSRLLLLLLSLTV